LLHLQHVNKDILSIYRKNKDPNLRLISFVMCNFTIQMFFSSWLKFLPCSSL